MADTALDRPLPKYSVKKILKWRNRILADARIGFILKKPLTQGRLAQVIRTCAAVLPHDIPQVVIAQSLGHLRDSIATRESIGLAAWRLAGNVHKLRQGVPVPPWSQQHMDEWVPFAITDWQPTADARGAFRHVFTCLALAGSPCATQTQLSLSKSRSVQLLYRFGLASRRADDSCEAPNELCGAKFFGLVSCEKSESDPVITDTTCSPGQKTENRKLRKYRYEERACPNGYLWTKSCAACAVGRDRCKLATHATTYTQSSCERCGRTAAWTRPKARMCVWCEAKQV